MTSPSFPLVVFDLDGTIADTAPDLAAALNAALVSLGRPAQSLEAVRGMIGHGTRALLRNGLAATGGGDEALVAQAYPVLLSYYEAHICDHSAPYPGVEQAWDALAAQGVRLALCTNKPAALTDKLLAALGWKHRFAAVVGGDTLAVSKPDPAPLAPSPTETLLAEIRDLLAQRQDAVGALGNMPAPPTATPIVRE